jgi:iron complex transport system substrate-binding protein
MWIVSLLLFLPPLQRDSIDLPITDDLQRAVTVSSPVHRIVSLAPSITETLFAIGAGDKVVGVTDFCNYPKEATTKPRIGGMINPSQEVIVSLKPDLIVLSMEGNVREDFGKLASLGIPMFVTNPRSLHGIYKSIQDLGTLTGHVSEARELVRSLQSRTRAITASSQVRVQRKVALIVSLRPLILVGSGTFLAELIDLTGAVNIAGDSPSTYPAYSRESVLALNPDIIILMGDIMGETAELVTPFPEWKHLSALRKGNVFRIDPDIVSRPGPRAIDGLEAIVHIIYHQAH